MVVTDQGAQCVDPVCSTNSFIFGGSDSSVGDPTEGCPTDRAHDELHGVVTDQGA